MRLRFIARRRSSSVRTPRSYSSFALAYPGVVRASQARAERESRRMKLADVVDGGEELEDPVALRLLHFACVAVSLVSHTL